jgi:DNA-binding NtrC family response regulator
VPKKILLVDDDENILFLFSLALEENGYRVQTASTGSEALDLVNGMEFDLILLDYRLTDKDGISLANEIHSIKKNTKIIIVTGNRDLVQTQENYPSVAKVLLKPVQEETLVDEVLTALENTHEAEAF